MPIQGNKEFGYWYSPNDCIKDKNIGNFCVSLDKSPDFEGWRPYSVTIHEGGSEGGSFYRALFTFRTEDEAHNLYNKLDTDFMIEKYLP